MAGRDAVDPVDDAIRDMVEQQLTDPGSHVTMGVSGALAEFRRRPGEPMSREAACVVTARGAVRIDIPAGAQAIAYETPTGPELSWNQAVALCLDAAAAQRAQRTAVTALGADTLAPRPRDRTAELFDLGLGVPTLDVCVRTTDTGLLDVLHGACGTPLTPELAAVLAERSPHRVFLTACGRVEVFTPIPGRGDQTPDGPHTHLLPDRLRPARTHPTTAPIADGLVTCLTLHPAHPVTNASGYSVDFDADRHAAFQRILDSYGDPVAGALKAMTFAAVRAGVGPDLTLIPRGAPARAAVVVTLRQIAHLDGPSDTLDVWRAQHPPDAELLHPDG